jgi:hypothetical protein
MLEYVEGGDDVKRRCCERSIQNIANKDLSPGATFGRPCLIRGYLDSVKVPRTAAHGF